MEPRCRRTPHSDHDEVQYAGRVPDYSGLRRSEKAELFVSEQLRLLKLMYGIIVASFG